MANASSCPEDANSTDCLLRVLLQNIDDHFNEYSWDPITFGFTVPIGVIAALFAAFTIYQATVASSRGSRKSNKRAIGEWSRYTTKRWDWHELCRISTAQTPILTTSSVLKIMPTETKRSQTRKSSKSARSIPSDDPSVASWLGFLNELGLGHEDLQGVPLKKAIADYLPGDLLAAPAYGEVGFLFTAAAAAGAHSWELDKQSGYPTIIGRGFQFEFRQHQTLGMVGAFVKYDYNYPEKAVSAKPIAINQLQTALHQSHGDLTLCRLGIVNEEWRGGWEGRLNPLTLKDYPLMQYLSYIPWSSGHKCRSGLCERAHFYNARDDHHFTWLLIADAQFPPPVVFPSRLFNNPDIFPILALHSKFWANLKTKQSVSGERTSQPPILIPGLKEESLSDSVYTRQLLHQLARTKMEETLSDKDSWIQHDSIVLVGPQGATVVVPVLEESIKFLYSPEDFNARFSVSSGRNREGNRALIALQLEYIDTWLKEQDGDNLTCGLRVLCLTTRALLNMKRAITNKSFGFSPREGNQNSLWDQGLRAGCPNYDIPAQHFTMLQNLYQLIDEFKERNSSMSEQASQESESVSNMIAAAPIDVFKKHAIPLSYLTGISSNEIGFDNYSGIRSRQDIGCFLQSLGDVLEICRQNMLSNKTLTKVEREPGEFEVEETAQSSEAPKHDDNADMRAQNEKREEESREKDPELDKSIEDCIRDVLIYRCILIHMLYSTALDNTDLLNSGMWERVVPVL
ncbi:hypothetical protein F4777DRAFT_139452 [Nemania sp. FL0916]|nr:hypothetical protein F4777DRAFT_139452 [Nemania sp. FL0916]